MKYLKLFDTESAYKAYRDGVVGGGYIQPNVSLSVDTNNIHYNLNANGHDYVDLVLPSGTLWATMNVGASNPSEYGLYFQWGDTSGYTADQIGTGEGKKKFSEDYSDYKWYSEGSFTKYTTTGATLKLEDDAAHVNMGGDWHMPTQKQCQELIDNTTTAWTTSNDGVKSMKFISKKDTSKFIFIPAAGYALDGLVDEIGYSGSIWSSSTSDKGVDGSLSLGCFSNKALLFDDSRNNGFPVRGVIG